MPSNPVLQHAVCPQASGQHHPRNRARNRSKAGAGLCSLQSRKQERNAFLSVLKRGALNMLLQKVNRRYRAYLEGGSYASHLVIAKWRATSLNSKVKVIRPCHRTLFLRR